MSEVPATPEQLRSTGAVLARVDDALVDFRHPHESRLLIWSLSLFPTMRHLATHIADDASQRLAHRIFDRFDEHVTDVLPTLEEQVIHGDYSPHNVAVDSALREFVSGVIDFGDVVRSPVLFELSVAAANSSASTPSTRGRQLST